MDLRDFDKYTPSHELIEQLIKLPLDNARPDQTFEIGMDLLVERCPRLMNFL